MSEDFAIFTAFFSYVGMMTMYVVKQKELASLLLDMSDFRTFSKPPLFDTMNKKLGYFVTFIFYYAVNATLIYNGVKIINIPKCRRERKIGEVCGTLTPVWTPFDTDHWLTLVLVMLYIFGFYVTVDRGIMFVALQSFEIACNIKLRIDQLNSMLLSCFEGNFEADRKRLNRCIQYHNLIISYSERVNGCFINEMFTFLATGGIIFGCLENQILKVRCVL